MNKVLGVFNISLVVVLNHHNSHFRYRKAKFSYWKIKSLMAVQHQEASYNVKKFNSGLALPIFSVTNLCNRKPMESFKVAAERKKKEKIEKEAFLHLKCRDMTRVQNYVTKGLNFWKFIFNYWRFILFRLTSFISSF